MGKLNENLVKLRKAKGMSQSEVAEKLYVTPQAVSRWERGETEPDVDTLVKIAEIYGVSVEDVVSGPTHRLNEKVEKLFHRIYLISSLVLILFSLVLISSRLWSNPRPRPLYVAFIVIAVLYLVMILTIEIIKEVLIKKNSKERKNDQK